MDEEWGHQGPVQPRALGVGPSPNESTPRSSRNPRVGGVRAELTRSSKPCWTLSSVGREFYLYPQPSLQDPSLLRQNARSTLADPMPSSSNRPSTHLWLAEIRHGLA